MLSGFRFSEQAWAVPAPLFWGQSPEVCEMSVTTERVAALVAPLLEDLGTEVYDVEQAGGTLRVLLDRPGGVDLEVLSEATHRISRVLDEEDPVAGSYTLEVSSPGLERRLRTPAHFAAARSAKVTVKTRVEVDGERRFSGTVASVDGDVVTVALEDGGTRTFSVGQVERARTVFEWGGAPKPGSPKHRSSQGKAPNQQQSEAPS